MIQNNRLSPFSFLFLWLVVGIVVRGSLIGNSYKVLEALVMVMY